MIYDDISAELLFVPDVPRGVEDPQALPAVTPAPIQYPDSGLPHPIHHNPPAETAGEQDHTDPWAFAGAPAHPPVNV